MSDRHPPVPEPSTPTPDVPTTVPAVSSCPKCKGGHTGCNVFSDTNPANAYHFCLDCHEPFTAPLPAWAEVTRQRDELIEAWPERDGLLLSRGHDGRWRFWEQCEEPGNGETHPGYGTKAEAIASLTGGQMYEREDQT